MDVLIIAFFLLCSAILSILGYVFKNAPLAAVGGLGFVLTGFSFITAGVDVQTLGTSTQLLNATDVYSYDWNATFNSSTVANITSQVNRTIATSYYYANATTEYTTLFAVLVIFGGLGIVAASFGAYRETRQEETER